VTPDRSGAGALERDERDAGQHNAVPLTILTGFLGAGKTTLLNRILSGDHGLRVAVLVNDFGTLNIDAELIVGVADGVVSLANGCTCCSLRDDLVQTVLDLLGGSDESGRQRDHHPPDLIVLEASGVADPGGITMAFNSPALRDRIRLDGVTCLVDADQVLALAAEPAIERLMLLQIAFSDMVVLNKVTMAGPGEVAAVRGWIDAHFDNIRVFATDFAEVPDEVLLSVGRYAAAAWGRAGSPQDETPDPGGDHPRFDTWTYATEAPMSLPLLRGAMDRLPGSVFRCKGIVRTCEEPERASVLQVVCRRVEITPGELWSGPAGTRLVVIGAPGSLRSDELQQLFDSCLAA